MLFQRDVWREGESSVAVIEKLPSQSLTVAVSPDIASNFQMAPFHPDQSPRRCCWAISLKLGQHACYSEHTRTASTGATVLQFT